MPSVINNMKLNHYNSLESNMARANMFVNSFILERPWKQDVEYLDRMAGMTKADIMAFANKHDVAISISELPKYMEQAKQLGFIG